jgi:hypothetical protein
MTKMVSNFVENVRQSVSAGILEIGLVNSFLGRAR